MFTHTSDISPSAAMSSLPLLTLLQEYGHVRMYVLYGREIWRIQNLVVMPENSCWWVLNLAVYRVLAEPVP